MSKAVTHVYDPSSRRLVPSHESTPVKKTPPPKPPKPKRKASKKKS